MPRQTHYYLATFIFQNKEQPDLDAPSSLYAEQLPIPRPNKAERYILRPRRYAPFLFSPRYTREHPEWVTMWIERAGELFHTVSTFIAENESIFRDMLLLNEEAMPTRSIYGGAIRRRNTEAQHLFQSLKLLASVCGSHLFSYRGRAHTYRTICS